MRDLNQVCKKKLPVQLLDAESLFLSDCFKSLPFNKCTLHYEKRHYENVLANDLGG